ncbi:MAG TPA: hypothetical protein ENK15_04000 [Thermopetrobacter sp.]|nr:hypothetical protein [Thermopetrobacter sp.]
MIARVETWPLWRRVALVALALSGVIGWMVADRIRLLRTGTEVVLNIRPIDPRDLFRGHYVRLFYPEISMIPPAGLTGLPATRAPNAIALRKGARIYVVLAPTDGPYWRRARAGLRPPQTIPPGHVLLIGRAGRAVRHLQPALPVTYGIERYYAPQARARALERRLAGRTARTAVILRVSPSGRAAIAGLMLDGKRLLEEPLF